MHVAMKVSVVFSVTEVITVCDKEAESHKQDGCGWAADIPAEGCS